MPTARPLTFVAVAPLLHKVVKGAVPPTILTETEPFEAIQVAAVADAVALSVPEFVETVFVEVLTQPFASVTVTV